jgi:hypothetical protein
VVGVGLRGLLGRAKRGSVEGREEGGGTIERREEVRSRGGRRYDRAAGCCAATLSPALRQRSTTPSALCPPPSLCALAEALHASSRRDARRGAFVAGLSPGRCMLVNRQMTQFKLT